MSIRDRFAGHDSKAEARNGDEGEQPCPPGPDGGVSFQSKRIGLADFHRSSHYEPFLFAGFDPASVLLAYGVS